MFMHDSNISVIITSFVQTRRTSVKIEEILSATSSSHHITPEPHLYFYFLQKMRENFKESFRI